ncbi:MAG: PorV/PorQ family protein [Candidatus Hydrogenedentota bacterium]
MRRPLSAWLFISYFLVISPALIAIDKDAGTSGAQFLKICVGARPSSMGEAYAGVYGDALSIYWNPAGLANVNNIDVAFQYNDSIVDIEQNFVSVALPAKRWDGGWAIGLTYLDAGEQIRTTETVLGQVLSTNAGTFGANDLACMLSYAICYKKQLNLGLTFKYIAEELEDEDASSFACDLGFIYLPSKYENLSIGGSIQNIGKKIRFINQKDDLPLNFKLGLAYRLRAGRVLWVADLNYPTDNELRFNSGLEWWVLNSLALRAGYSQALTDADDGLTLGCGIRYQSFTLDYAFLPMGDLGDSHRVSAGYKFGR